MKSYLLSKEVKAYEPSVITENSRYAAVALIVYINNESSSVFFVKRNTNPADPWSGQIGLPGGHYEQRDKDLLGTSIRETFEETAIKLTRKSTFLQLNDQQGYANAGKINLTIRPFVFMIEKLPRVKINYELSEYFWISISHLTNESNHIFFNPMPDLLNRPGVRFNENSILWGMTYRILFDFFIVTKINAPLINDNLARAKDEVNNP